MMSKNSPINCQFILFLVHKLSIFVEALTIWKMTNFKAREYFQVKIIAVIKSGKTKIPMNDDKKKIAGNEADKIAISFYLTSEALEKIDDFIFYTRKRLPIDKRRKLSRSVFYEIGLKTVIEDFNIKGEQSALWKAICALIDE